MDVSYPRWCGLDGPKQLVVACGLTPGADKTTAKAIRPFGPMTPALRALAGWLTAAGVPHVAMESTGSSWKPIWHLLAGQCTRQLAHAQQVKAGPGRKRDGRACAWLAQLRRHGLRPASLVPDRAPRELREVTRDRTSLVHARTAEINRLQQGLEGATIKRGSVVSAVTGVAARAMRAALVAGETDPAVMADLARGALREQVPVLEAALTARVATHQRFLVAHHLAHIAVLAEQIERLRAEIGDRLVPFDDLLSRLDTIPGGGRWTAAVILAAVGTALTRVPREGQLVRWAGLCPGQDQSAGNHRRRRTRNGSPWRRTALPEAASAAGRTKPTALGACSRRLAVRKGRKRAAIAVGRLIRERGYHLATSGQADQEPPPATPQPRTQAIAQRRLIRQLARLGNNVIVEPLEAA